MNSKLLIQVFLSMYIFIDLINENDDKYMGYSLCMYIFFKFLLFLIFERKNTILFIYLNILNVVILNFF